MYILLAVDNRGKNRLHVSVTEGHIGVTSSLIDARMCLDTVDADGLSALVLAVREGCYTSAKLLIESGACVTSGGGLLGSALHVATVNLDLEMCRLLLGYRDTLIHNADS